jgi:hypothetical protein
MCWQVTDPGASLIYYVEDDPPNPEPRGAARGVTFAAQMGRGDSTRLGRRERGDADEAVADGERLILSPRDHLQRPRVKGGATMRPPTHRPLPRRATGGQPLEPVPAAAGVDTDIPSASEASATDAASRGFLDVVETAGAAKPAGRQEDNRPSAAEAKTSSDHEAKPAAASMNLPETHSVTVANDPVLDELWKNLDALDLDDM